MADLEMERKIQESRNGDARHALSLLRMLRNVHVGRLARDGIPRAAELGAVLAVAVSVAEEVVAACPLPEPARGNELHERIARALGWSVPDTQSFSMQALRDLVRPIDAKLAEEVTEYIRSGAYITTREG